MKKKLSFLAMATCLNMGVSFCQTSGYATGPSSSQTPYILPTVPGAKTTSILTTTDVIGGYKMCGTPDGLGAFDNGNGTFTLLMNHEFVNTVGAVRAHGSTGAFVSKWIINKSDLSVVSGSDLIQNVKLWNGVGYDTYNAAHPSTLAAFGRLCSADLPPVSAFYNSATGLGTQERIFMNGEETNDESRAFAHIVTGPNGGTTYELPYLGKASWENSVANPVTGDKTVVGLMNDGTDGQVYFYIGTKTNTGTEVDKAGLNNGRPFGIKVTGFAKERINSTTINNPPAPGTRFTLVDLGSVENMTGAAFNTASNTAGVTSFSRPEDGAWDPSHPNDFYFNTTDQLDQVTDAVGTQVGRTRVWRLRFDNVSQPELGGTVEAVVDGTEGVNMLDNMAIDNYGHIILLEDVGNSAHNGKVWQYTIATDVLTMVGKHDPARFGDLTVPPTPPFTQDEETSGIIDVQNILGQGMFLLVDQAHYPIAGEAVEGGQLLAYFNPDTYNAAPHAFTVTGGGFYCSGQAGVSVGLGGSETGVNYQLIVNGSTHAGSPVAGTGSAISFGIQSMPGVYTVLAVNSVSGISASMTGSATITANPTLTVDAGSNKNVYDGYAPMSCTTLSATGISGGTPGYSILWSTGSTAHNITVCPSTSTKYMVTVTDSKGCKAKDSVQVCAIHVKCGKNDVQVCGTFKFNGTVIGRYTYCLPSPAAEILINYFNTAFTSWSIGSCNTSRECTFGNNVLAKGKDEDFGVEKLSSEEYALIYGDASIKLYPNPSTNSSPVNLEIRNIANETVYVTVKDLLGREVYHEQVSVNNHVAYKQLHLGAELNPGTYVVSVITGNTVVTEKMMIQ